MATTVNPPTNTAVPGIPLEPAVTPRGRSDLNRNRGNSQAKQLAQRDMNQMMATPGVPTAGRKGRNTDRFGNLLFSRPRTPLSIQTAAAAPGRGGVNLGNNSFPVGAAHPTLNRGFNLQRRPQQAGGSSFTDPKQFSSVGLGVAGPSSPARDRVNNTALSALSPFTHTTSPHPKLSAAGHQNQNQNQRKKRRNRNKPNMLSKPDLERYVAPHLKRPAVIAANNHPKSPSEKIAVSPVTKTDALVPADPAVVGKPAADTVSSPHAAPAHEVDAVPNASLEDAARCLRPLEPVHANTDAAAEAQVAQAEAPAVAGKTLRFAPTVKSDSSALPTLPVSSTPTSPGSGLGRNKTTCATSATGPPLGDVDSGKCFSKPSAALVPETKPAPLETKRDAPKIGVKRNRWPKKGDVVQNYKNNGVSSADAQPAASEWSPYADDDEEDPNADVEKLVDWEGKWLPAPIDWELREGHKHRNFSAYMIKYVDVLEFPTPIDTKVPAFTSPTSTEVAPRLWIPDDIEEMTPGKWWDQHTSSKLAECAPDAKPWWERYESADSDFIEQWPAPPADLDPSDRAFEKVTKGKLCSEEAVASYKKRLEAKAKQQKKAQKGIHISAVELNAAYEKFVPINAIKPRAHIFLREAYAHDIPQITEIYNRHIRETVHCPEMTVRTVEQMRGRFNDAHAADLPYIVAIEKSSSKIAMAGRNFPVCEKVVGFAFADDYHDSAGMYRYTLEFEMYVHKPYQRLGIGSCLMDRLMYVLDPEYMLRTGYRFHSTGPKYESGGVRVAGALLCHVPYESTDTERLTWLTRWLGQHDFKKVGDYPEIGHKLGKAVNLAVFYRKTGNTVNPANAL